MTVPLGFISTLPDPAKDFSLGDHLDHHITGRISSFLDCLPSTPRQAIFSTDSAQRPISHREVRDFVSAFTLPSRSSIRRLGPNDRVMVVLPTTPESALALLAISCYHTAAPVNTSCTAAELLEDAARLGAKAVLSVRDAEDRLELRNLCQKLGCEVIYVERGQSGTAGFFDMHLIDEAKAGPAYWNKVPSKLNGLDDLSLVLHTSGTSGKKKVVPYNLRSLIIGTCAVVKSWDLREDDVNLNMMPLFHVGGIVRNLFAPILSGGSAIMCAGFDATQFWVLSIELGATWYYAAPTMHQAILGSRPDGVLPSRDTKFRLICNAAGGLLPVLAEELKDTFNAIILPSYGSTECMPIASPPTTYRLDRPGCSGIACGPHLSIRDSNNLDLQLHPGQTGAICVRGLPTFTGYETTPDRSVPLDTSTFTGEGWFDTGDCGYLDGDGYLFITGRSKEIINRGGEVISPFEIEEAILVVARDRVQATIAFAVEHDKLQETIGVVIVPVPDTPRIGLSQLHALLRSQLHPSKWPFAIIYMDDLPKNSAGKPLRINLASRLSLGKFSDSTPFLQRHHEATAPEMNATISQPIPCSPVISNIQDTEEIISHIPGIVDLVKRIMKDGSQEFFLYVEDLRINYQDIQQSLEAELPGYCIPDVVHLLRSRIPRFDGRADFLALEKQVAIAHYPDLSPSCRMIRNIVADLLGKDPSVLNADSDFFLLGGNSLLLGRLSYAIRKDTGTIIKVSDLFANPTISAMASLIDESSDESFEYKCAKPLSSESTLCVKEVDGVGCEDYRKVDLECHPSHQRSWGQTHPVSLITQIIPTLFFYPFKAAWTWTLVLVYLAYMIHWSGYWERAGGLLLAIFAGRLGSRLVCPIAAILFKWIVIGKYRPGCYRMWSSYHLRWWLVNAALRSAGRGVFATHPELVKLYFRLLGARVGKGVKIDRHATLGEFDLLTLEDGCCIDKAVIRGFCVEQGGCFRLAPIHIGRNVVINTFTQVSPGVIMADDVVLGPHTSSHDSPSPHSYRYYNRALLREPHSLLKLSVGWPIITVVIFLAYIPWLAAIYGMVANTEIQKAGLNSMESVIMWFATPRRIAFHILARVLRVVVSPIVQVVFGIIVKRTMGLNKEGSAMKATQWSLLRRYINHILLSQDTIRHACDVFGTHYEMTSVIFRAMGAKVGKRVYWPGSGIYCPDPELLEIGDDVVFGSRSEIFTSDNIGSQRISIGSGAMIADRVVLLPGCRVGRRTVMGSGALAKRGGIYMHGSTWMGNEGGEAVMFSKGSTEAATMDTLSPFGKAFYRREANYFVLPYPLLVVANFVTAALSASFWASPAVVAAQILRLMDLHCPDLQLYAATWYRPGVLYGIIAFVFVVILTLQSFISMVWVILTKWLIIGRRTEGQFPWDMSSYCQRWQLHLTLSRPMYRGHGIGGVLAPLAGSAYIVWFYRALGARIGKNCSLWASGKVGLMTEPDLVTLGEEVSLDDCSVVAHINSRGMFALNRLRIGNGCALRTGSRLLSGAQMEDNSMLVEHTLLPSGDIADEGQTYYGWPARRLEQSSVKVNVREEKEKDLEV